MKKAKTKEQGKAAPGRTHRVFVYGTLLTGERNANWAGRARRQKAWTLGTIYDTKYGFPAFVKEGGTRIEGEVLTVGDEGFRMMDRLEGYPRLYRREEIEATLEGGERVKAWVYIMNQLPDGAPVIESGNWVAYRKAELPRRGIPRRPPRTPCVRGA